MMAKAKTRMWLEDRDLTSVECHQLQVKLREQYYERHNEQMKGSDSK